MTDKKCFIVCRECIDSNTKSNVKIEISEYVFNFLSYHTEDIIVSDGITEVNLTNKVNKK